ncbi:MAG: DUF11 domain-containing protein, partial [Chloroflexaceae bacterium]|nr:DUF11 domain-containing protein [Chloroflexaceae bacterium]
PTSPPGEEPTSPPGEEPTSPPGEEPTSTPSRSGGGGGGGGSPREGNVAIIKSMDREQAHVGEMVNFWLTVTNEDGRSDNVVIRDTLHPCLTIVNATTSWGDLAIEGNTVTVAIDRLFDEDEVTVHILASLNCQPESHEIINTATVSSTSDDDEEEDNVNSVTFQVGEPATPTVLPTDTPTLTPETTPSPTVTSTPPAPMPSLLPHTGITDGNLECHAARMVCDTINRIREQVRDTTRDVPNQGEHRRSPGGR